MTDAPLLALSIRQPWAWLIAEGYKPIENRSWPTSFRGRFLIHASKGMTKREYCEALEFCKAINIDLPQMIPNMGVLERGGIVGEAEIVGCFNASEIVPSPWFVGPYGFRVARAKATLFQSCRGMLGFFKPQLTGSVTGESGVTP